LHGSVRGAACEGRPYRDRVDGRREMRPMAAGDSHAFLGANHSSTDLKLDELFGLIMSVDYVG